MSLFFLLYDLFWLTLSLRIPSIFNRFVKDHQSRAYRLKLDGQVCTVYLRPQDLPIIFEIFQDRVYDLGIPTDPSADIAIIDLGAHIGMCSLFFQLNYFPNAQYICVEPADENFNLLQKNTAQIPHIKRLQQAIDTTTKTAYLKKEQWSYNYQLNDATEQSGQKISTTTIADLITDAKPAMIHLIKMDIEGKEIDLLKADTSWFSQTAHFVVELHNGYSTDDLIKDLQIPTVALHHLAKDCFWIENP